jgi:hypothetical protein
MPSILITQRSVVFDNDATLVEATIAVPRLRSNRCNFNNLRMAPKSLPCGLVPGKSLMSVAIVVENAFRPYNGRSSVFPLKQMKYQALRDLVIRNVLETVGRSNCRAGLLLFFVICRRERPHLICVQRPMTWSSKRRLDDQSMPILSPGISNPYLSWPVCRESDSTICTTRQQQSRWQPERHRRLYRSNWDTPVRRLRWTYAYVLPHMQDEAAAKKRGSALC